MPTITLTRVLSANTSATFPAYTSNDLFFGGYAKNFIVVGTAGAPAGVIENNISGPDSTDSTYQICHAWFGWDLNNIPVGAIIQSATLRMTTFYVNPSFAVYDGIDLEIQCLNKDVALEEDTLQYNNEPNAYLNAHTTTYNLDTNNQFTIAMSADVKVDLVTRRTFNYGYNYIYFRLVSVDTSEGVNFRPSDAYLDVTYTLSNDNALFFGSD